MQARGSPLLVHKAFAPLSASHLGAHIFFKCPQIRRRLRDKKRTLEGLHGHTLTFARFSSGALSVMTAHKNSRELAGTLLFTSSFYTCTHCQEQ